MRRARRARRNPDLVGDLLLVGALVGAAAVVGNMIGSTQVSLPSLNIDLGSSVKEAVQGAVQGVEQGINSAVGTSILPGGVDYNTLCQAIAYWKHNQTVFNPLHLIFPPADPNDWLAFRDYAKKPIVGLGYDPGLEPPLCWYQVS